MPASVGSSSDPSSLSNSPKKQGGESVASSLKSGSARPLSESQLQKLAYSALVSARRTLKHSSVLSDAQVCLRTLPRFEDGEILTGRELGKGQFGSVCEVRSIVLKPADTSTSTHTHTQSQPQDDGGLRERTARNVVRDEGGIGEGDPRYAVKFLHPHHAHHKHVFFNCYRDMALEIYFLASLNHRHILQLRGLSRSTASTSCSKCFFLTDRLYGTLQHKLVEWKHLDIKLSRRSTQGSFSKRLGGIMIAAQLKERKRDFFLYRMRILRDMASAIVYLHEQNIIQRDLKPDNVGFDIRGEVKLFDFGVSTLVPAQPKHDQATHLYQLTARVGSLRYMAPENYRGKPYNHSIDVYAYAMMIWQVLTLQPLYPNFKREMIVDLVIHGGLRPELNARQSSLTDALQYLLKKMWSTNILQRPDANQVLAHLQKELANFKQTPIMLNNNPARPNHEEPVIPTIQRDHPEVNVALLSIARDLQNDLRCLKKLKDRMWCCKIYHNCFLHKDAMDWFIKEADSHYYAHIRERLAFKAEDLGDDQAKHVASNLGNLMIQHGYLSHVCHDHLFDPKDINTPMIFRFCDHVMDDDYHKCSFSTFGERDVQNLQKELWFRITSDALMEKTEINLTSTTNTTRSDSLAALPNAMYLLSHVQRNMAFVKEASENNTNLKRHTLDHNDSHNINDTDDNNDKNDSHNINDTHDNHLHNNNNNKAQENTSLDGVQMVESRDGETDTVIIDNTQSRRRASLVKVKMQNHENLLVREKPLEVSPNAKRKLMEIDIGLVLLARQLHNEFKADKLIRDHMWHFKLYKKCWLHHEAMNHLQRHVNFYFKDHVRSFLQASTDIKLTEHQSSEIASRLGKLLVQKSYAEQLPSEAALFHPETHWFFRFCDRVIDQDSHTCSVDTLGPMHIQQHLNDFFRRVTMETFCSVESTQESNDAKSLDTLPRAMFLKSKVDRDLAFVKTASERDLTAPSDSGLPPRIPRQRTSLVTKKMQARGLSALSLFSNDSVKHYRRKTESEIEVALLVVARDILARLRSSHKIKDHLWNFKVYKQCFDHVDAMDYLVRRIKVHYIRHVRRKLSQSDDARMSDYAARQVASCLGNQLLEQGYVTAVCHDDCFHPHEDLETLLLFRFCERVIDDDSDTAAIQHLSERQNRHLQDVLYFKIVKDTLFSDLDLTTLKVVVDDYSHSSSTKPHPPSLPNAMYSIAKVQKDFGWFIQANKGSSSLTKKTHHNNNSPRRLVQQQSGVLVDTFKREMPKKTRRIFKKMRGKHRWKYTALARMAIIPARRLLLLDERQ